MSKDDKSESSLNPALKQTEERDHAGKPTPAPIESVSAHEGEGEGWPIVWLVVAVICIGVTIYLFL